MTIRVLYTDIDNTLVGPFGNLFHTGDRQPTLAAATAIIHAAQAGLEIVPLSGRSRVRLSEVGRLLGLRTWFCELGGLRVYDAGDTQILDPGTFPGPGLPAPALSTALAGLVDAFDGLEAHEPWNEGREISLLLRGEVDNTAARSWLDENGFGWAEIHDNGVIPRKFPTLPHVERVRIFHLSPRGIGKAGAIAADQMHRGIDPAECAMIGDSPTDLACHSEVDRCFVVRNAVEKDPDLAGDVASTPNAAITTLGFGEGFAEVVEALLR